MLQRPFLHACVALLVLGSLPSKAATGESSFGHCATLYGLWTRYEPHSALHTGHKARADIALECDCQNGRYERGTDELQKLLRRSLIPIPERPDQDADPARSSSDSRPLATLRSAVSKPSPNWK
jgi:hypothetical protein